jgi:anti-sigma factor RsiW
MTAKVPGMTITCQQVVAVITDYLEDDISPEARTEFEAHLALCPGCDEYLAQMRLTIDALGHVPVETLSPDAQSDLLSTFRNMFPVEP